MQKRVAMVATYKPTEFWIPDISQRQGPMYLAIADALAADVLSGTLSPGTRLPAQRALADALKIDFTTVTRAYAEARKRGLVEGKVGQGTYVRAGRTVSEPVALGGIVDMSMNLPPRFDEISLASRMWNDIAALEQTGGAELLLRYQEPGGTRRDRNAGAQWLSSRLGDLSLDRILVCPGAQGALLALLGALADPGDSVCAESLTYPGFLSALAHLRLKPVGVAIDEKGIVPESFELTCREYRPKALYCNPTLHNPTTATMPLERRKDVAEIARAYGVPVIEDDAYGALPRSPVPPMAALAPDIVYHVAGLAKCLAPALRMAYLVLPQDRPPSRLAGAIRATASMASPLTAATATQWIESGTAAAVLDAIREETAARSRIAKEILPAELAHIDPEGFHVWMNLPEGWTRADFVMRLRHSGIGVVSSDAFAVSAPGEAVRLALGVPSSRSALRDGLRTIAAIVEESPALSSMVV